MKLTKFRTFSIAALLLSFHFSFKAHSAPFQIGVSTPLSGPVARFGHSTVNGMQIAIDELNKDKISPAFEMVTEDDQCKPSTAVTNIHKFQDLLKLNALVVTCTAVAPAIAPLTKDRSIVFSTSAKVASMEEKGFNNYFCLQPPIHDEVKLLLSHAQSQGIHSIGLVITQNDFMKSYQAELEKQVGSFGMNIIAIAETEITNTDFRSLLLQVTKNKPEAIFAGLAPEPMLSFLRQKNEIHDTTPVLSGWAAGTTDLIKAAGSNANGLVFSYPYKDDATEKTISFKDTYTSRFGEVPDASAASAYDAVYILASLLSQCSHSHDTKCFVERTESLKNFSGASGIFSIHRGSAERVIYLKTVKNGSLQFLP